jgi:16S rRNA (cytosine1402-N4)-methyltransferase
MNKEIVNILSNSLQGIFIDCTIGMGGHSYHILQGLKDSKVIAIDIDNESIKQAEINLKGFEI